MNKKTCTTIRLVAAAAAPTETRLPRLTLKLAQQIAKRYFGTAAGLHLDEDTNHAPAHYRRYEMEIGQLQICISYTPDSNDYSRLAHNCIHLHTQSNGGVGRFGSHIDQYINPTTLDEDYDAEDAESVLEATLYERGEL